MMKAASLDSLIAFPEKVMMQSESLTAGIGILLMAKMQLSLRERYAPTLLGSFW
jgi:hypothetical protein